MQVRPDQLPRHLARGLAPVYLVYGDEPLQVRESLDAIRAAARADGFQERMIFDAEAGFDWGSLQREAVSLSLFAARRLLELRLPGGKIGEEGAKTLRAYADQPPQDVVLVVSTGALEAKVRSAAWYRAVDGAGTVVQAWPVETARLPGWIQRRAGGLGLVLDGNTAELIADRVEGNLLACAQEIEKLRLLHGEGTVDAEQVLASVLDSARFKIFDLVDSALAGDGLRTARILRGLCLEGAEPALVLWALGRDLRTLCSMARERASGAAVEALLAKFRIWDKRKPLYKRALGAHSHRDLLALLRELGRVDRVIKGFEPGTPWDELMRLAMALAGVPLERSVREA